MSNTTQTTESTRKTITVHGAELGDYSGAYGADVDCLVTSSSEGVAILSVLARDVELVESQLDADDAVSEYSTRDEAA